ncbi:MAG TPA: serine hydrolase [Thermoleophilaceae bacterium]|jgi:hypothetical protein
MNPVPALLLTAAVGLGAAAGPGKATPREVPRLFDTASHAPPPTAPRFFDANGSAPKARVPHLFRTEERAREAAAAYRHPWAKRIASAGRYAESRAGRVAFAVVDEKGRVRGRRVDEVHRSASVVKAMFLVAYLNQPSVRDRELRRADRRLLRPMVTRSDNATATQVRNIVGRAALDRLARRAGMQRFSLRTPWGDTRITPADQARYFTRIDLLTAKRHRTYARKLLASIVPEQRWGVPRAQPEGWRIFFKGGWRALGGRRLVNQVALLESGERRIALAVLTDGDPSHDYGTETIRGVAKRLLRGLRR